jgi:hypothetical protein
MKIIQIRKLFIMKLPLSPFFIPRESEYLPQGHVLKYLQLVSSVRVRDLGIDVHTIQDVKLLIYVI